MNRSFPWRLAVLMIVFGAMTLVGRAASAEWFFDAYGGVSITSDADVTVPGGTAEDKVSFDTEAMGGGRIGYWLDGIPWLGVAGDISYFAPAGDGTAAEVRLEVIPLSPLVMFRLPLLETPEFTKGRLQPYLAVGPGFFMNSVKVDGPGGEASTDWQLEVGVDARAGIAFMFTPTFGTFVEGRYTWFATNPGGQNTEFDIETFHFAGGISFRWQ